MTYTYSDELISDLHKDAHGKRPSLAFWDAWTFDSDKGKQATWDYLVMIMNESVSHTDDAEAQNLRLFKDKLQNIMADRGCGWKEAIRRCLLINDMVNDIEHFLWQEGISFAKIDEIIGCYNERSDR
tara:strand:+ start:496 stop:876 length:381 start_codon:yes stop_codon:yes gene_type:complete